MPLGVIAKPAGAAKLLLPTRPVALFVATLIMLTIDPEFAPEELVTYAVVPSGVMITLKGDSNVAGIKSVTVWREPDRDIYATLTVGAKKALLATYALVPSGVNAMLRGV